MLLCIGYGCVWMGCEQCGSSKKDMRAWAVRAVRRFERGGLGGGGEALLGGVHLLGGGGVAGGHHVAETIEEVGGVVGAG